MAPVYAPGQWLNPDSRPSTATTSTAGRFAVPLQGGRFERHRHDGEELWFISEGKAKAEVDGELRYVQAGDIVFTSAGDFHDIVEVYEPVRGFFTEGPVAEGGRPGHLDAEPHDVPALPLPDDFPVR